LHIHCRTAYGSVLCAAGRWPEAEALLREALGSRDAPSIAHRALTVAHLAGLRLDQGRVDEAAELLAPFEDWVTSCEPLARVHLRRGDHDLAAAVLRRGLSELVGDALRAGPLLAALVEVELARGDVDRARAAADALAALAAGVDLVVLHADAALAAGRVAAATGDLAAASTALATAKTHLPPDERPLALGTVRLELARRSTPAVTGRGRWPRRGPRWPASTASAPTANPTPSVTSRWTWGTTASASSRLPTYPTTGRAACGSTRRPERCSPATCSPRPATGRH
jgi:tetratricopeptide (TPR) repeat protein